MAFLSNAAHEIGDDASFEDWTGSPNYSVCQAEALNLTGGDQAAAEEILSGMAPMHEIPKEFRAKGQITDRVKWIFQRAEESKRYLTEVFGDLSDLMGEDAIKDDAK